MKDAIVEHLEKKINRKIRVPWPAAAPRGGHGLEFGLLRVKSFGNSYMLGLCSRALALPTARMLLLVGRCCCSSDSDMMCG